MDWKWINEFFSRSKSSRTTSLVSGTWQRQIADSVMGIHHLPGVDFPASVLWCRWIKESFSVGWLSPAFGRKVQNGYFLLNWNEMPVCKMIPTGIAKTCNKASDERPCLGNIRRSVTRFVWYIIDIYLYISFCKYMYVVCCTLSLNY